MFIKISQYSQDNTYVGVSFLIKLQPATLLKRDSSTGGGVCSEYCKIFKNTFFYSTPPVAACVFTINIYKYVISLSAKITNKTLEYYKNNMLN